MPNPAFFENDLDLDPQDIWAKSEGSLDSDLSKLGFRQPKSSYEGSAVPLKVAVIGALAPEVSASMFRPEQNYPRDNG